MKVLFVSSSVTNRAGGVYDSMRYLSQALMIKQNAEVSVLGVKQSNETLNVDEWFGANVEVFNYFGPYQYAYSPGLVRHAVRTQSHVIHSHGLWMYPTGVANKVSRKTKVPYVISPHGMLDEWIMKKSPFKKRLALKLFEKSNIAEANCIHALTDAEAVSIRNVGYKGPIFIQPNGISLPDISETAQRDIRDYDGVMLESNKKRLLFLGRIDRKKGIKQLIDAWEVISLKKGWELLICGWGEQDLIQEVQAAASRSEDIYYLGPKFSEEKKLVFGGVDAFILPSFSEGLPMTVLEAWSYEKPVIMSKNCNLDLGFEYNAAIQVSPTVDSIACVLENVFDRGDLSEVGRNGRVLAENLFGWEGISDNFASLYRWLNGDGEKPGSLYLD